MIFCLSFTNKILKEDVSPLIADILSRPNTVELTRDHAKHKIFLAVIPRA